MVYWLGGEWGVFQTSYKVINPALSLEERQRHMQTAYRIDILARMGIIALLPLGLHMGYLWGMWGDAGAGDGAGALWLIWLVYAAVLAVTLAAYFNRGKPIWSLFSTIEDWTRYIAIPSLLFVSISSLMGYGPFAAGEGQKWYSAKILTFGLMLCIGVILRLVMHEWQKMFAVLAAGPNAEVEARLKQSIGLGRSVAYVYWVGIALTGFFGAVKPF
ncbi:MAG: hypothetical protein GC206_14945 [Alphaproteobacteria bacterium]|nr:hypothetical protein [Alphaproteobacteria bacterium]